LDLDVTGILMKGPVVFGLPGLHRLSFNSAVELKGNPFQ